MNCVLPGERKLSVSAVHDLGHIICSNIKNNITTSAQLQHKLKKTPRLQLDTEENSIIRSNYKYPLLEETVLEPFWGFLTPDTAQHGTFQKD